MRRILLPLLASLALVHVAGAQTVLYQTSFDDLLGWSNGPCWSADATPSLGGTVFHSPPYSLNCNANDAGFYGSCVNTFAVGPSLDLGLFAAPAQLSFWCKWVTENDCLQVVKKLLVVEEATGTWPVELCMSTPGACPTDDWHQHTVALDPSWGKVAIHFWFDSYVASGAILGGWMIDDLVVSGTYGGAVGYCTAKVNSLGCTPTIASTGVPSASAAGTPFVVLAQNVLNQHPGLLIWSLGQGSNPFGGGTLCLGSPVNRTAGQTSGGSSGAGDCSGSYAFAVTPDFLQAHALVPGTALNVQFWSRDTGFAAPQNIGLTAALHFNVCE